MTPDQARAVLSEEELDRLRKSSWPDYPFPQRLLATIDAKSTAVLSLLNELEGVKAEMAQAKARMWECGKAADTAEAERDHLRGQIRAALDYAPKHVNGRYDDDPFARLSGLTEILEEALSATCSICKKSPPHYDPEAPGLCSTYWDICPARNSIPAATGEARTPQTFDPEDYPYDHARSGDPQLHAHRRSTDPLRPKQVSP